MVRFARTLLARRKRRKNYKTRLTKSLAIVPAPQRRYRSNFNRFAPTGFPPTQKIMMRYCESFLMQQGMIIRYDERAFSANSINAPNALGGGHRPLGWDQWNQFYEKYVVVSSRITVTCQSSNASPPNVLPVLCVYRSDQLNPPIVLSTYIENKGKYIIMSATTNGNSFEKHIRVGYSAKKQHNITDIKDCESLEALMAANPTDQTYYNIMLAPWDDSSASNYTVPVTVVIDYNVLLKDPKPLLRSI